jgi:phosphate transport system protein
MTVFDAELTHLKEMLLRQGGLVEAAVREAVRSLTERDEALARRVIEEDAAVNALENEIDEECIRLLALRQPKAGDLRLITTAMKINTDLERMGDLAVDIAERAVELSAEPSIKPYIDIPRMAGAARGMVRDALDAFVRGDAALAREVIGRDDEVDALTVQIFNELMIFMVQDPAIIPRATRITYVAKYLERLADHATNIGEMVIFLVEGKWVRHLHPEDRTD